jgi:hypothetical protein
VKARTLRVFQDLVVGTRDDERGDSMSIVEAVASKHGMMSEGKATPSQRTL